MISSNALSAGDAEGRRNRGAAVPRIKGVVNALTTLWKTGKPIFLANCADLIQLTSQKFYAYSIDDPRPRRFDPEADQKRNGELP